MKKPLLITVFLLAALLCAAQTGSITVTSVQQRSDGSGLVDGYFNLSGPASAYNITMQASFDGGSTYNPIPPAFLSGDIAGINPGSNKHIVWDGLGSFPATYSTQAKIKLVATQTGGFANLLDGLITYLKFDEGSGATLINSTGGNNATITGYNLAHTSNSKMGPYGITSAGNNNAYVSTNYNINIANAFTYNIWIKLNTTSKWNLIFGQTIDNSSNSIWVNPDGKGWFRTRRDVGLYTNERIDNNTWHMMTLTYNGHNISKAYLNGVEIGGVPIGNNSGTNLPLRIGNCDNNFNYGFVGLFDEAGVWNRALTANEVQQLYNNGNGLQYPF